MNIEAGIEVMAYGIIGFWAVYLLVQVIEAADMWLFNLKMDWKENRRQRERQRRRQRHDS